MLIQFCPRGSPGLDGWTTQALRELDPISAGLLCELFDQCDIGRFPRCLCQARVVGIAKNDGTQDRRPVTILSVLYRCWAGRAAYHTWQWMHQHMPSGVYGGRRAHSATTAAWAFALQVDAHRVRGSAFHALAMDQKQCFDRLSLSQLRAAAVAAGMPGLCIAALGLHGRLERHLFMDGQPTGYVLAGGPLRGIPQGCPLSVHLCNLTCWFWHRSLAQACPSLQTASFVDDRLLSSGSLLDLEAGILASRIVDAFFGAELNLRKTCWSSTVNAAAWAGPLLGNFRFVFGLKYFGVDVVLRGGAACSPKPCACTRCVLARQRVRFIAVLPAAQRGNLVSDTVSGLYAAGGTALYPTTLAALTSDLAGALRGRFTSACRRRCRLAEHLLGPSS